MKRWMAGVAVGLAAAGAGAGDIYSDEQKFLGAVGAGCLFNPFDDVEPGFHGSLYYYGDDFEYAISAQYGLFCAAGEVSTLVSGEPLIVGSYSGRPATAIGGHFWVRDAEFNVVPGEVTIVYDDGTKDVFPSDGKDVFRGYVSGGPRIAEVHVIPPIDGGDAWAVVDNLYIDPSGIYADEGDFLDHLGVAFFNPFDDVQFGKTPSLEYGPRRGISYTITAPSGLFCNTGEVSTEAADEPIVMAIDGERPRMFGGRFGVRDANFDPVPGQITLIYNDGTVDVFRTGGQATFRGLRTGFADTVSEVQVFASADVGQGWPLLDDVWVGTGQPSEYCWSDCNGDGSLDLFDFLCFIIEVDVGSDYGDCNGDGAHDLFDFLCFVNMFFSSC